MHYLLFSLHSYYLLLPVGNLASSVLLLVSNAWSWSLDIALVHIIDLGTLKIGVL